MAATNISGKQVKDGSVQRTDLDTTTAGQAVVVRVLAGTGISLVWTGVDAGTGDVTINATGGAGSTNIATAVVDFGPLTSDSASVTLSAPWVTALSVITPSVRGLAPDHPPEDDDVWLERLMAHVLTITPGVGFTVAVSALSGTWGRWTVSATGV